MGGLGGGLRSASAQCGVVKRDVTNCLKERAEAALNYFCATRDTLVPGPLPGASQHSAGPARGWECWPSTISGSPALNPHILWLPTLLFAQLGTSHLQAKSLCPQNQCPPITGPTRQPSPSGLQKPSQHLHLCLPEVRGCGTRRTDCGEDRLGALLTFGG